MIYKITPVFVIQAEGKKTRTPELVKTDEAIIIEIIQESS